MEPNSQTESRPPVLSPSGGGDKKEKHLRLEGWGGGERCGRVEELRERGMRIC